jgi:hypothetical protein
MWSLLIVGFVAGILPAAVTIDPTTYSEHDGNSLRVLDGCLGMIHAGNWVGYDDVMFDREYDRVSIDYEGGRSAAGVQFFADSLTGVELTSVCDIKALTRVDTFELSTPVEGMHSVFVVFSGGAFSAKVSAGSALSPSSPPAKTPGTPCRPGPRAAGLSGGSEQHPHA